MFSVSLLSAALATTVGSVRPVFRPSQYFPLVPGTTWVYQVSGPGGGERRVSAPAAFPSPGDPLGTVTLDGYFPGAPRRVRSWGGRVEEVGVQGERFLWYLLDSPEGTSWELHTAPQLLLTPGSLPCYDGARLTLVSRKETLTVPYGSFQEVILVRWATSCQDAGIVAEWFAPGVGLIQREEASFAGRVVWQLQELRHELAQRVPNYGGGLGLSRQHYVLDLMPPVELDSLPKLEGSLVLWSLNPESSQEPAFPSCLQVVGEILDENQHPVVRFEVSDPTCSPPLVFPPPSIPSTWRFLPFHQPLVVGGRPLPQGSYTVRLTVENPSWRGSFSLPFKVSHVY